MDAKSRQNAVMQFNKGRYDILIANDQADIDEVIQEGEHTKVNIIFLGIIWEGGSLRFLNSHSLKKASFSIFRFRQKKKTKKQLKKLRPI